MQLNLNLNKPFQAYGYNSEALKSKIVKICRDINHEIIGCRIAQDFLWHTEHASTGFHTILTARFEKHLKRWDFSDVSGCQAGFDFLAPCGTKVEMKTTSGKSGDWAGRKDHNKVKDLLLVRFKLDSNNRFLHSLGLVCFTETEQSRWFSAPKQGGAFFRIHKDDAEQAKVVMGNLRLKQKFCELETEEI